MSEFAITGLAELQKALDQLPEKLQKNVLRGALRQGAKVQMARARELVPVADPSGGNKADYKGYAGALRDSLRISTKAKAGVITARVTAGTSKTNKLPYYAIMVERGTAAHYIKPKTRKSLFFAGLAREVIHHPGAKKKPFMRPALDGTVQAAVGAVAAYIRKKLEREGIDLADGENR